MFLSLRNRLILIGVLVAATVFAQIEVRFYDAVGPAIRLSLFVEMAHAAHSPDWTPSVGLRALRATPSCSAASATARATTFVTSRLKTLGITYSAPSSSSAITDAIA